MTATLSALGTDSSPGPAGASPQETSRHGVTWRGALAGLVGIAILTVTAVVTIFALALVEAPEFVIGTTDHAADHLLPPVVSALGESFPTCRSSSVSTGPPRSTTHSTGAASTSRSTSPRPARSRASSSVRFGWSGARRPAGRRRRRISPGR